MEVHHHSHSSHGKKNWKSYFWEFVMLFLAVFCGFLAEYQLEHVIEHQREVVYIKTMIEDAETDRVNIKQSIDLNNERILHLDSLANICLEYSGALSDDYLMYKHFKYGLIHPSVITPTERTIMQLKNAGGMRLIRSKQALDKILIYDDMSKKLANQRTFYELYQNNSISLAAQIFNFKKFGFSVSGLPQKDLTKNDYFKLFSKDKTKLIEFANQILIYEGVVNYYNQLLHKMDDQAINLIQTLKNEYQVQHP